MPRKAKIGRDKNAFKIFNGGFDTYVTADDAYIFSDSHTTLSGDTVDNKGTAALAESSLNDVYIALVEQKDQAGEAWVIQSETLLVPQNS